MKKTAFVVAGLLVANAAVNAVIPEMAKSASLKHLAARAGSRIATLALVPAPIAYKKVGDAA